MANFNAYLPLLQAVEGGYQNISTDPGNFNSLGQQVGTNYGISARFYETVINRPPSVLDMRNISKTEAEGIFKTFFWDKNSADKINNQQMAQTIIDHHVNAGNGAKLAQELLNDEFGFNVSEDNQIGPESLSALNSVNPRLFVELYNELRKQHYLKVNNSTFLEGWLIRLRKFAYNNPKRTSIGVVIGLGLGAVLLFNVLK